jgi:hypothetical protein
MFNRRYYRESVVPVLVLKAYGEWRYSYTNFNLSSRWRWMFSFMFWYFVSLERTSVYVLNKRTSVYHVNQQNKLDMACCFFTDSSLVQRRCLLDSKSSIILTFTYMSIFYSHSGIHYETEGTQSFCFKYQLCSWMRGCKSNKQKSKMIFS